MQKAAFVVLTLVAFVLSYQFSGRGGGGVYNTLVVGKEWLFRWNNLVVCDKKFTFVL